jgi:hypothetical protein
MAYRACAFILVLLIAIDAFFMALRSNWNFRGGVLAAYLALGFHEFIVVLQATTVFALFSATVWFGAGLLGQLGYSIRATMPLFVLKLFLVQMPWVYKEYLSKASFSWEDPWYIVLYVAEVVVSVLYWCSLLYTLFCMTEKKMYAPYHRELHEGMSGGTALDGNQNVLVGGAAVAMKAGHRVVPGKPGAVTASQGLR